MSTIPDVHSLPIYTLFRGSTDIKDNFKIYPLSADGDEMQAFVPGPAGESKRTDLAKPARIIAQTAPSSAPAASEMLQAAKPTLTANLRGRTLLGTRVDLPTGYTGAVMLLGSAAATAQETIATSIVEAASSSSGGGVGSEAASGVGTMGAKRPRDDDDMFDCDLSDAFFKAAAAAPVAASAATTTTASTPSTSTTIVGQHYPSIPGVTFDSATIPHSKDPQAVFQVTNLNTSANSVEKLEKAAKARIMMLPAAHLNTPTEQHDAVFHTFPSSYVVWEHDYPATFTDTKGPMLWLELASELHASD